VAGESGSDLSPGEVYPSGRFIGSGDGRMSHPMKNLSSKKRVLSERMGQEKTVVPPKIALRQQA